MVPFSWAWCIDNCVKWRRTKSKSENENEWKKKSLHLCGRWYIQLKNYKKKLNTCKVYMDGVWGGGSVLNNFCECTFKIFMCHTIKLNISHTNRPLQNLIKEWWNRRNAYNIFFVCDRITYQQVKIKSSTKCYNNWWNLYSKSVQIISNWQIINFQHIWGNKVLFCITIVLVRLIQPIYYMCIHKTSERDGFPLAIRKICHQCNLR